LATKYGEIARLCLAQSIELLVGRSVADHANDLFFLAVAAVSAICFALVTRAANAGRRRRGSPDGGSYDPSVSSTTDSTAASWFGSNHFGPSTDAWGSGETGGGWSGGDSGGGGVSSD
jgi:hypothetical protein